MRQIFLDAIERFDSERYSLCRDGKFEAVEMKLQELLALAVGVDEKQHVFGMLANHYNLVDDAPRALRALQDRLALCPESAQSWLGLAEYFHYHDIDLAKASENIEIALEKSLAEGVQVVQVLGARIRIALEMKDYARVNDSLSHLLEYTHPPGSIDVAPESDFISQLPHEAVDADLLARYEAMVRMKN